MADILTKKPSAGTLAISETYQISFWLKPSQTGLKPEGGGNDFPREVYDKIVRAVTDLGGSIISESKPAKKHLAYPIKHIREAFFGTIQIMISGQSIASILDAIKHENGILRLNIFALKEKPALASRSKHRPRKLVTAALGPKAPVEKKEAAPGVDLEALDKKLEEILKT